MTWCLLLILALPQDDAKPLETLKWMVGDWTGNGNMPGFGEYRADVSFHWTMNRNFIAVTQKIYVGGKQTFLSTGMIGWDRDKKKFAWFQFGLDGTIGASTGEQKEKVFVNEGETNGKPPFRKFRTTWSSTDKDALLEKLETHKDGKYELLVKVKYERKKEKKK